MSEVTEIEFHQFCCGVTFVPALLKYNRIAKVGMMFYPAFWQCYVTCSYFTMEESIKIFVPFSPSAIAMAFKLDDLKMSDLLFPLKNLTVE